MPVNGVGLQNAQTRARESAERGNDVSSEYAKNMNAINSKIVLLALGTASLLMTFLGILFASDNDVSRLEYKYILLALCAFLATSALLLLYSWFVSMFRFLAAAGYHYADRAAVAGEEITIATENGITDEDGSLLTDQARADHIAEQVSAHDQIQRQSVNSLKWSERHNQFSIVALLLAYALLITAYVFTALFFVGVVDILNMK